MGIKKMLEVIKKHNYCQVCTSSRDDKIHSESQSGCPRAQQFKCKNCPEPRALTHCTLLCTANKQGKKTKQNGQPPNSGGGGPPNSGGGGSGQPPANVGGGGSGNQSGYGFGGSCHGNAIVPYQHPTNESYGVRTWNFKTQGQKPGNPEANETWKIQG